MKVHELIEILKTHDSRATVEIELPGWENRKGQPLTRVEAWRFLGLNTVVLRTDSLDRSSFGKKGDIVDAEPVQPKLR